MLLADGPSDVGGLTGWIADVVTALGAVGVGLLVALENVIPPVPSEIVLSMSGYLASQGELGLVAVVASATAGSLVGALLLYWLGAALGQERIHTALDKLPLVDSHDLRRADRWFERYGSWAVFFARMVPVARSLVSVPAGATRMPLVRFLLLTALGSGLWNALFVGLGYGLGSRWRDIEQYSRWFDLGLLALAVGAVAWYAVQRRRRRARA